MNSVDNRIVKMQFDNGQFESGARTTMSTLQRLKEALNFTGAGKNLSNVLNNAGNTNLSGLEKSVDTVNNKFSILAQAAAVALGNIATQAIQTGASMVKAFAIDPITQGFGEYELKMNSIQTMMMSTGEPLERVNQKLDELNTYADKTIYSFSDMTQNIGKFTNAGVNLDKSVAAIQGVANVAALSGANANEASHAMYNFGQALSAGAVKLIDWKSIENANMATVEFKNELIKTALSMGTLVQQGDRFISTTTDLNGHVSDAFNATSMFNDSLSSQWMTTEVLTETLNRYADETTDIGKKAFKAATQVKTFSQLIDTTKEAIGSGWAQSFEIVIGNFNEALSLWTKLSGIIDNFVSKQSDARNNLLKEWKDLGGRNDAIQALSNVFHNLELVMTAVGRAWRGVFPAFTAQNLVNITKSVLDFTEKFKMSSTAMELIRKSFVALFQTSNIFLNGFRAFSAYIPTIVGNFFKLIEVLGKLASPFLAFIDFLSNSVFTLDHFRQSGELVEMAFDSLSKTIKKWAGPLTPIIEKAESAFKSFAKKVDVDFDNISRKVRDFDLTEIPEKISKLKDPIKNTFKEISSIVDHSLDIIKKSIKESDWFPKIEPGLIKAENALKTAFSKIENVLNNKKIDLSKIFNDISNITFDDVVNTMSNTWDSLGTSFDYAKSKFNEFRAWLSTVSFDDLKEKFEEIKDFTEPIFEKIEETFEKLKVKVKENFGDMEGFDFSKVAEMLTFGGTDFEASFQNVEELARRGFENAQKVAQIGLENLAAVIGTGVLIVIGAIMALVSGINSAFAFLGIDIGGVIEAVAYGIKNKIKTVKQVLNIFKMDIMESFDEIGDVLIDRRLGMNLESTGFAAIAFGIKTFLDSISSVTKGASGVLKSSSGILDAVKSSLSAYQRSLNAQALIRIAGAIAILAASMVVLATIPAEQVEVAATALGVATLSLIVSMAAFSKLGDDLKAGKILSIAIMFVAIAGAFALLAGPLETIASMDSTSLLKGIGGISVILFELAAILKSLDGIDAKGVSVGVLSLFVFAQAVRQIANVAADLGTLNPNQILQGVVAIAALVGAMGAFVKYSDASELKPGSGLAVIEVATAILELSAAVKIFGNMNIDELTQGLLSVGILLGTLGMFTKLISGSTGIVSASAGMMIMGVALLEFTAAVAALGSLPLDTLQNGILALSVALAEMVIALMAMQNKGLQGAVAIFVVAAALGVLTPVLLTLGATFPVAAIGIAVIAGALITLGLCSLVLSPLAPILMTISTTMLALSASSIMAGVGITLIGTGLATLALGITALASAGSALQSLLDSIVAILAGILDAFIELGPKLEEAFVVLLEVIAFAIIDSANVLVEAIVRLFVYLCEAIEMLAEPVAQAFMAIIEACIVAIADHTEEITDAGMRFIIGFIDGITAQLDEATRSVGEFIVALINATAMAIREFSEPIMAAVMNVVSSIIEVCIDGLAALVSLIPVIGEDLAEEMTGMKRAVRETLAPETMYEFGNEAGQALGEGFSSTLDFVKTEAGLVATGAKNTIEENSDGTFDIGELRSTEFGEGLGSMKDFCEQNGIDLTDSALSGILSNSESYGETGNNYGDNFSTMLGNQSDHANASGTEVTNQALAGIHSNDPDYPAAGDADGANFSSGLGGQQGNANAQGAAVAIAGAAGAGSQSSAFYAAGDNAGSGFCAGLSAWIGQAQGLGATLGNIAANATAAALQEHSPSRKMRKIGNFAGEGLILGGEDSLGGVERMGSNLGNALLEATENSIKEISDTDLSPTIKPVIDMTDVQNSANSIQSLMDSVGLNFGGGISFDRLQLQNGSNFDQLAKALNNDNSGIIDEVQGLREDIGKLALAVTSMQIVLDSGVLVGATSAQMDAALQTRQVFAERGM